MAQLSPQHHENSNSCFKSLTFGSGLYTATDNVGQAPLEASLLLFIQSSQHPGENVTFDWGRTLPLVAEGRGREKKGRRGEGREGEGEERGRQRGGGKGKKQEGRGGEGTEELIVRVASFS